MRLKFTKMHGLGNDYIFFDCVAGQAIDDPAALARRVSDRHFGIGGDGIILILPAEAADFGMRMFNVDGSEGEMCGNAIRCVGKYVYEHGYTRASDVSVHTKAGVKHLELSVEDGRVVQVRVDMGAPILKGKEIPVAADREPVLNEPLEVGHATVAVHCVSMGNPHCVVVVDELTDELVRGIGPQLETHPFFPARTNVEFVRVMDSRHVQMRVWERGSGETLACGTGASATVVACALTGLTERRAAVQLRGGVLDIDWAANGHVYMTGPATHVFDGEAEV